MNIRSALAALACLLVPVASHAGVIYEWRALGGGTPRDITLRLEFTHQAVQSGALDLRVPYMDWEQSYPDSGLVSLFYDFPGLGEKMRYAPPTEKFRMGMGTLDMRLRFDADGVLSGWIRANDQNSHFEMHSQGRVFTILDANSDRGMPGAGCGMGSTLPCAGATGELRQVPEPHSVALLAMGALGAWGARRRRR